MNMSTLQCVYCGKGFEAEQSSAPATEVTCPHCGRAFNSAKAKTAGYNNGTSGLTNEPFLTDNEPILAAGAVLGQYEIKEMIGRGGMGTVYKAYQPLLDRHVAIKVLPSKLSEDQEFLKRFYREAKTLAGLSHPNIVAIYDMGRENGQIYFVMEFIEGVTLRKMIESRKLSPEEALGIVPQLCGALEYAHTKGVVHRDIKPENIMLDQNGQVKIADFGLARIVRGDTFVESITKSNEIMGTYDYMAPEQRVRSKDVDHRVDIYSIGVVFYEMLTGELPIGKFELPSRKVQIDVRVDDIVMKSLENEPGKRFQRASEVGSAVTEIITDAPRGGKTQGSSKAVIPMPQELKTALAGIASLVLGVVPSGIGNIIAVFLGLFTRSEVRKGRGDEWASGLANVGIIAGLAWLTIEFIGMSQGHFYGFLGTLLIGGVIYSGIALAGIYILGIVFGESNKAPRMILLIVFGIYATVFVLGTLAFIVFKPSSGFTIKSLFGNPEYVQNEEEKQDEHARMEQLRQDIAAKERKTAEDAKLQKLSAEKAEETARYEGIACDTLEKLATAWKVFMDDNSSISRLSEKNGIDIFLGKDAKLIGTADRAVFKSNAKPYNGYTYRIVPFEDININHLFLLAAYPEKKNTAKHFFTFLRPWYEKDYVIYSKHIIMETGPEIDKWAFLMENLSFPPKTTPVYNETPALCGWRIAKESSVDDKKMQGMARQLKAVLDRPAAGRDERLMKKLDELTISMDFESASIRQVSDFINKFFAGTLDPETNSMIICVVIDNSVPDESRNLTLLNSTLKNTLDIMSLAFHCSYTLKQGLLTFRYQSDFDTFMERTSLACKDPSELPEDKNVSALIEKNKVKISIEEPMPLDTLLELLRKQSGTNLVVDYYGINIDPGSVTVPALSMNHTVSEMLRFVTEICGLEYRILHGAIIITGKTE